MSVVWTSWSYRLEILRGFDENFEGVSDQPMQAHCHQFQGTSTSCAGHHYCSHRTAPTDSTTSFNHGSCFSNPVNPTVWYPDSGASNHVTNDLDNLQGAAPYTGYQDRKRLIGRSHS
ncbi:uncharacterized protein [Gossypium hirsutum]|uniref:Uncharacterized protein isoform X1 n=1 Tax=Gossypium hirsutum TaxID=3635 RepID=A0ABM2YW00_GOSHI|nr:uncharacterized protein LOC121207759 isoform X1 [Gossypium hirsutum]